MYKQNMTRDEKKKLFYDVINHIKQTRCSERQACKKFNIPKSTFYDWKNYFGGYIPKQNTNIFDMKDGDNYCNNNFDIKEVLQLSRENEQIKSLKKEKQQLIGLLKEAYGKISIFEDTTRRKPKYISIEPKTKENEVVIFSLLSDWHIDEVVEPSVVSSLNAYNPIIAKKRIQKLFNKILEYIRLVESNNNISYIILAALGDFISGYIHDELEESNAMSPPEAILLFRDLFVSGVNFILSNTKYNIIIPCCYGNHGRTGKDYRISTAHKNSYEWLIYHVLEKDFADDDRVTFMISDGYHIYIDVFGKKIRFHHGNGIRGGNGDAGIYVPVNRAIRDWNRSIKADLDCFGHFHQEAYGRDWVCNPSAIGWNAFAVSIRAPFDIPKQTVFCFDKEEGRKLITSIPLQ